MLAAARTRLWCGHHGCWATGRLPFGSDDLTLEWSDLVGAWERQHPCRPPSATPTGPLSSREAPSSVPCRFIILVGSGRISVGAWERQHPCWPRRQRQRDPSARAKRHFSALSIHHSGRISVGAWERQHPCWPPSATPTGPLSARRICQGESLADLRRKLNMGRCTLAAPSAKSRGNRGRPLRSFLLHGPYRALRDDLD